MRSPRPHQPVLHLNWPEVDDGGWYLVRFIPVEGSGREVEGRQEADVEVVIVRSLQDEDVTLLRICGTPTFRHGKKVFHHYLEAAVRNAANEAAGPTPPSSPPPSGSETRLWWAEHLGEARAYARTHHLPGPALARVIDKVTPDHPLAQKLHAWENYLSVSREWVKRRGIVHEKMEMSAEELLREGLIRLQKVVVYTSSSLRKEWDTVFFTELKILGE